MNYLNLDDYVFSYDVALAEDSYQFLEDTDEYNEAYFLQVYQELENVVIENFNDEQELYLIVNKLLKINNGKDLILPKVLYSRKRLNISGKYLAKTDVKQQIIIKIKKNQIKWETLLKSIINQDFPDRKPRFKTNESYAYPEVYLVNQEKSQVLYLYDDRGYRVFNK
ncbi:DUF3885 domain-containing protein [Vagococcus fluvialis]|uniref:DUF3885 domain-containing protein n=1 Tax=Vagococcus fluvialis TaxID=2738 RepID=UPI0037A72064